MNVYNYRLRDFEAGSNSYKKQNSYPLQKILYIFILNYTITRMCVCTYTVFVHRWALFGGLITYAIFIRVHRLHTIFSLFICLKINHKLVGKM